MVAECRSYGVCLWELMTGEVPRRGQYRPPRCAHACISGSAVLVVLGHKLLYIMELELASLPEVLLFARLSKVATLSCRIELASVGLKMEPCD